MTPNAWVTYVASYPDAIRRVVNTANYGTNGGSALSRPATVPTRADTVLVNSTSFDSAGNVLQTTDPLGIVTRYSFDAVRRKLTETQNYTITSS